MAVERDIEADLEVFDSDENMNVASKFDLFWEIGHCSKLALNVVCVISSVTALRSAVLKTYQFKPLGFWEQHVDGD